jgi:methylmalonyl-CoA carboxyltransferase large subunit
MEEDLRKEVASLRSEVAELRDLVAKLTAPPKAAAPAAPAKQDGIDEQTMFVISAAIAAFLGKRATIRSVRPLTHQMLDVWRLQGRVAIQGSHRVR